MRERLEMPVSDRLVTAEEFEQMPEDPVGFRHELVRGRVIRMVAPGGEHGAIVLRLGVLLYQHVEAHGLGTVFDQAGCKLETNPDTVRVPDLAFVRRERIGPAGPPKGFLANPDLAVEVVSPTDRPRAVRAKATQYLERGVRMVWVVDPEHERVTVYEPGKEPLTLRSDGVLDGGDVVPGFRCDIRRIFH